MENQNIKQVYLVFKTHLDVGFTDYAREVKRKYFDYYIPGAIKLSQELRQSGGPERFVWTTGSWLIYEYLETSRGRQRKLMERAIEQGDIAWHGLPFTTHSELMDADLFRFGVGLSKQLDRRFGRRTISAKMTDVPGHTRAIVPLLVEAGIQFLHIGVNPASTPLDVPDMFIWRQDKKSEVVVMYDKGTYGKTSISPDGQTALCFAHTGDNLGPQSPDAIKTLYANTASQFVNAKITASSLDSFARRLVKRRNELPTVTEEFGDTWIHGVGTDPTKLSAFRELCRLRRQWLSDGVAEHGNKKVQNFSRLLLVVPEHTWGMNENVHLDDYENYSTRQLRSFRRRKATKIFESSWDEQRAYLRDAVKALGKSSLAAQAVKSLKTLTPTRTKVAWKAVDPKEVFDIGDFRIGFDHRTGAINDLIDRRTKRSWASARNPLALFRYQTFSQDDYDRYTKQYLVNMHISWVKPWAIKDFTKPGIDKAGAQRRMWLPTLKTLSMAKGKDGTCLIAHLELPEEACAKYGGPREVSLEVGLTGDHALTFKLQWFKKPPCRMPEALWLSFCPPAPQPDGWIMNKMGQAMSPLEVVSRGNRHLHAVQKGVSYHDADGNLEIETLDAALVAPGKPSLLNFTNKLPDMRGGMHFNLYNNIWGTNFPMWFEDDALFRFILRPG